MDKTVAHYRFHYHFAVLKRHFQGRGTASQNGKKKGGIKVHAVIYANEGVPCDVQFTSAATNDSFMLAPSHYKRDEITAMDRAYINYAKFEGEKLTDTTAPPITHFWVFCPLQRCTSGPCERRFPRQKVNFSTPTAEFFKHYS